MSPSPPWPAQLDPPLVQRLTRPLRQPGAIDAGFALRLAYRHERLQPVHPQWQSRLQRQVAASAGADGVPIVYAQPWPMAATGEGQSPQPSPSSRLPDGTPSPAATSAGPTTVIQAKLDPSAAGHKASVASLPLAPPQIDPASTGANPQDRTLPMAGHKASVASLPLAAPQIDPAPTGANPQDRTLPMVEGVIPSQPSPPSPAPASLSSPSVATIPLVQAQPMPLAPPPVPGGDRTPEAMPSAAATPAQIPLSLVTVAVAPAAEPARLAAEISTGPPGGMGLPVVLSQPPRRAAVAPVPTASAPSFALPLAQPPAQPPAAMGQARADLAAAPTPLAPPSGVAVPVVSGHRVSPPAPPTANVDLSQIADQVERRLRRKLIVDRERRGWSS